MSKDFTGGISSLLGEVKEAKLGKKPVGRPKGERAKGLVPSTEVGTKEGETRTTFIISKGLLDKVKGIAYWDRLKIKDVVELALWDAVKKWEDEKGKVTPIPGANK